MKFGGKKPLALPTSSQVPYEFLAIVILGHSFTVSGLRDGIKGIGL